MESGYSGHDGFVFPFCDIFSDFLLSFSLSVTCMCEAGYSIRLFPP